MNYSPERFPVFEVEVAHQVKDIIRDHHVRVNYKTSGSFWNVLFPVDFVPWKDRVYPICLLTNRWPLSRDIFELKGSALRSLCNYRVRFFRVYTVAKSWHKSVENRHLSRVNYHT